MAKRIFLLVMFVGMLFIFLGFTHFTFVWFCFERGVGVILLSFTVLYFF